MSFFFFKCHCDHLELHVLTHPFPTRRSSDLVAICHVGSHVAKALPLFRACFSALHCDVDEIALGFKIMGRKASCRAKDCARAQCVKTHHQPASKLDLAARQRGEDLPELIGMKRSEEHTSELQSLMRLSYAVFCLKKKNET